MSPLYGFRLIADSYPPLITIPTVYGALSRSRDVVVELFIGTFVVFSSLARPSSLCSTEGFSPEHRPSPARFFFPVAEYGTLSLLYL